MITDADTTSPIFSDVVTLLGTFNSSVSTLEVHAETPPASSKASQSFTSEELPITIFLTYASADNEFKNHILDILQTLQLQGYPITWICYDINQAVEFFTDIRDPLRAYQLFLFLLSPDFVKHEFCYSKEVCNLIERHLTGIWVSPILVRVCRWERTPFGSTPNVLPVLPNSRLPVTKWPDPDEAYDDIAAKIERAIEYLRAGRI